MDGSRNKERFLLHIEESRVQDFERKEIVFEINDRKI
jgi:hypothetical protein